MRLVPAIDDGVVVGPVPFHTIISQVETHQIILVVSRGAVGLVTDRSAAAPSAGSPAEKVDPALVAGRDVFIVRTDAVELVLRKTPGACRGLVLQVATREEDNLVRRDGEIGVACSFFAKPLMPKSGS